MVAGLRTRRGGHEASARASIRPWKLYANGVIQNSPGSGREAVATPGIDGIEQELQGSSTNRHSAPEVFIACKAVVSGDGDSL